MKYVVQKVNPDVDLSAIIAHWNHIWEYLGESIPTWDDRPWDASKTQNLGSKIHPNWDYVFHNKWIGPNTWVKCCGQHQEVNSIYIE